MKKVLLVIIFLVNFLNFAYGKRYWIFFKDKGDVNNNRLLKIEKSLPDYQLKWRQRFKKGSLADWYDIPVNEEYINKIRPYIKDVRWKIKILNAISVELDTSNIEKIKSFDFVKEVKPVAIFYRKRPEILPKEENKISDYMTQLRQIKVDALHEMGYHGEGVRIGVLDTGFRLMNHAFDSIKIIAKYDFVNKDTVVENETGQDVYGQDNHGSCVLSIIGGYYKNKLVGPAYKAEFLLGKTEMLDKEEQIEEDNYVAGLQWCVDSGAMVISTSLGYIDWYKYSDLDGNTSITAKAVNIIAQERDVLVVTAMGNEGSNKEGTLITPADAFYCIAVGAVDEYGNLAPFSSTGPTADGRIKPDILAMGVLTYHVSPYSENLIERGNGTSFATPLVGGACALIRQIRPELTVSQIIDIVHTTGSRADNPDNYYGYGIMNAFKAAIAKYSIIEGYVKNKRGLPIPGVFVYLYKDMDFEDMCNTDKNGYFSFNKKVADGYSLVFHIDGYKDTMIYLTGVDTSKINIVLPEYDDNNLVLYPNPAESYFKIRCKSDIEKIKVYIYTIDGKLIFSNEYIREIDFSHPCFIFGQYNEVPSNIDFFSKKDFESFDKLQSGIYIVKVKADNISKIFKVIKK